MYDKIRYIKSYSKCLPRLVGGRLIRWWNTLLTRCALFIFVSFILNFKVTNWSQTTRKVLPFIIFDIVQNCVI